MEIEPTSNGVNGSTVQTGSHIPQNIPIQTLDSTLNSNKKEKSTIRYNNLIISNSKLAQEFQYDFKYIIHPIDNEFEAYCQRKVDFFEELKHNNNSMFSQFEDEEDIKPLNLDIELKSIKDMNRPRTFLLDDKDIKIKQKTSTINKEKNQKTTFLDKLFDLYNNKKTKHKISICNPKPYQATSQSYQTISYDKEDAFHTMFKDYINGSKYLPIKKNSTSMKRLIKKREEYTENQSGRYNTIDQCEGRVYRKIKENKDLLNALFRRK